MKAALDHLVYATADLEATTRDLEERLGVRATTGGRHVGLGTHNSLVGLGDAYLEIIGPDPSQPSPIGARPFGIDELTAPLVVTWAIRVVGIDEAVARSRLAGHDPGEPREMSRTRPDGLVLRWRLTPPAPSPDEGIVPFLIDWGESPHPARGLPEVELLTLHVEHPDVDAVRLRLRAVGADVPVTHAPTAALVATLRGRGDQVTLR